VEAAGATALGAFGVEGALGAATLAGAAAEAAAGAAVATAVEEEEEDLTMLFGYTHMTKVFLSCFYSSIVRANHYITASYNHGNALRAS
jgi:hypothetical protein